MGNPDQMIMVIDRNMLFDDNYFEGFMPHLSANFESNILLNSRFTERTYAEENPNLKQPIGYIIIVNSALRKIFVYRRSPKDGNCSEKRLRGKWSCGIGGHIEKSDIFDGNPIRASMVRELKEEVNIGEDFELKIIGYINDDSDDVGKVHFGLLYIAETNIDRLMPNSPELEEGRMMTIGEIEKLISKKADIEKWSMIALEAIKTYLKMHTTDGLVGNEF